MGRLFAPAWVLLFWIALASAALAQVPDAIRQRLDRAAAGLDQIEASLSRHDLTAAGLQELRTEVEPIATAIQGLIDELTPRLNAAKTRLDQLGPKAANEPASVTAARSEQQNTFDEIDAAFRRARLLAVEATQISAAIGARRRILFTHALFERTSSILAPALWAQLAGELPRDVQALRLLASDWLGAAAGKVTPLSLGLLGVLGLALAGLYLPLTRLARRLAQRETEVATPTRLQRAIGALRVAVLTAAVPILAAHALAFAIDLSDLVNARTQPLVWALVDGVKRIAIGAALARGMLAPARPGWRLVRVSDKGAEHLVRLVVTIALIVSTFKFIEAVNDAIAAPLVSSVIARAIGSLLVAAAIALTCARLVSPRDGEREELAPRGQSQYAWYGPARVAAWLLVLIIAGSVLVGYIALAAFLVDQVVWIAALAAMLYLALVLADEGIDSILRPSAPIGRMIVSGLGIRRQSLEQISVLLSGAAHLALVIAAVLLVLAPWGLQSEDLISYLRAAFFGFTVGDVTISLSTVVIAGLLFLLAILATRAVQRWLDAKYMPRTRLDPGLRNSIRTSLGYLGVATASALALSYLGLSFEKFALVAGALSVGIGFGLQSIVSNFVSGLILLWERAIRVGDWIVVGAEEGYVRRINVRSTEIETFERATVIVPNSNLVTGVVKNWVRTDRVGRVRIAIGVAYDTDPEQVRDILIACAKAHDLVLAIPAPGVFFTNFGETAIEFELICFVDDVEMAGRIRSDLNFAIYRRLQEVGIAIPAPRRDIRVRDLEGLEALLAGPGPDRAAHIERAKIA